ncbi:MAG TPA: DCC1-like thiol-disulfide oxidoreductase family protein [Terracidiphilus sp.]|nr:DCC1-like thiol-disulfide oxidoreductase family protein [Terracidiphilus sp.]
MQLLVLFDGHCGFCNASIRWFLRRDRHGRLRFAPADDPRVTGILARHGLAPDPSSILVVRNAGTPLEEVLVRSNAALTLLRELPQPWPSVAATLRLVPRPLRDLVYRLIARLRYRLGPRLAACPIPTPAERARFL